MNVGCILMAAGAGQRFGGDKLLAEFKEAPLYAHALACIPAEAFAGVAVVAHAEAVLSAARRRGFCAVYNSAPEAGVSRTIALGMDALAGMDALLFLVADQPLLRPESVRAQIAFFRAHPHNIVALGHGARRGNPVVFPKAYFPALRALSGDVGGSAVIRANPDALLLFAVENPLELADVDTVAALQALANGQV